VIKITIFIFPALFFACAGKNANHSYTTYETMPGGDTVNMEHDGLKQGPWLVLDSNELHKGNRKIIDTVYYKDNKVIDNK
jgi:hypothetical protein